MRLFAALLILPLAACGATQSPECVAYLECQAALDEQTGSNGAAALEPQYGKDGTCWMDPATAASCDAGCTAGLEAARASGIDPLPAACAE